MIRIILGIVLAWFIIFAVASILKIVVEWPVEFYLPTAMLVALGGASMIVCIVWRIIQ